MTIRAANQIELRTPNYQKFPLYCILTTICEVLLLIGFILQPERGYLNLFSATGTLLLIPVAYLAIVLFLEYRSDYSKLFIVVGYPLLLSYCLFLLPSNVPDENAHIRRMFDLFPTGNQAFAPKQVNDALDSHWFSLYSIMYEHITEPANYEIWTGSSRYAGYSWFVYFVPYVIGRVGIILNANPWISVFIARYFNLTVFFAVGYWVLKSIPIGKAFIFVFMLNPIMLQQQASCSADSLTNTSMFLFVGQLLTMRFTADANLNYRDWGKLLICLSFIALCKPSNLPLAMLCFILLPKIGSRHIRRAIIFTIPIFIGFSLFLLISAGYAAVLQEAVSCFDDPLVFAETLGRTLLKATPILCMQYFGGQLGWPELNEKVGEFYIEGAWIITATTMAISLAACRINQNSNSLSLSDRNSIEDRYYLKRWEQILFIATGLVLFLLSYIALSHGLYYYETELGYISWMQGRHFLPAGLILGLSIAVIITSRPSKTSKEKLCRKHNFLQFTYRILSQPSLYAIVSGAASLYTIIVVIIDIAH